MITFKKELIFTKISRRRIITGIIIGLVFSFTLYSFLFTMRETTRIVFSLIETPNNLYILPKKEVKFYDLMSAIFSSILGMAITLKIILEKPKQFGYSNSKYFKKQRVFNDLSAINSYFLNVLSRLLLLSAAAFASYYSYYFNIYPKYKYIVYLLLIVMFLEQWKTIRLISGNKAIKWMFASALTIIVYSLIISNINIVNFDRINNSIIKSQPFHTYKVELPEVYNYSKIERKSLTPEFTIAYKKTNLDYDGFPFIVFEDYHNYSLEHIDELIAYIKSTHSAYEIPILSFKLNIDKEIKMLYVIDFENKLIENDIARVTYGVTMKDSDFPKELQENIGFSELLYSQEKIKNTDFSSLNIYSIKVDSINKYLEDGKFKKEKFKEIKKHILKSPKNTIFILTLSSSSTYGDYIKTKDAIYSVYKKIRNDYSLKTYGMKLDDLNLHEAIVEIKSAYPIVIIKSSDFN